MLTFLHSRRAIAKKGLPPPQAARKAATLSDYLSSKKERVASRPTLEERAPPPRPPPTHWIRVIRARNEENGSKTREGRVESKSREKSYLAHDGRQGFFNTAKRKLHAAIFARILRKPPDCHAQGSQNKDSTHRHLSNPRPR